MSIAFLLAQPFAQHALLAAALVAVSCGPIGPFVVTRGMSFAVHGTAELAFTGAAVGLIVADNPVAGALAGSLVVAALIATLGARPRERDSAIGTILASGMGIGVLLLGFYRGFATAATNILFGNIFGVSGGQLLILVAIGVVVVAAMAIWCRPLLFASIDPEAAEARGVPVRRLGLVFLIVLALTVTGAAQVVGTLLVLNLPTPRPPPPSACPPARSSWPHCPSSSPWPRPTAGCWPASAPATSRQAYSSPASASPSTSPRAWPPPCSGTAADATAEPAAPSRMRWPLRVTQPTRRTPALPGCRAVTNRRNSWTGMSPRDSAGPAALPGEPSADPASKAPAPGRRETPATSGYRLARRVRCRRQTPAAGQSRWNTRRRGRRRAWRSRSRPSWGPSARSRCG